MKKQWSLDLKEKTPFNALAEYDRLMGEKCRDIILWRILTGVSNVINLVLIITVVWAFSQNQTVPIFVSENAVGEITYLGSPSKSSYGGTTITPVMIQAHLRRFITKMYTIPQDSEVLKDNLRECYASLTSNSASKLSRLIKENSPFDNFGFINQTVTIETVLGLSEDSYQIDFIVESSQVDGMNKARLRKRAILTTDFFEPHKDDMLLNPIGIYIINFDVTDIGEE